MAWAGGAAEDRRVLERVAQKHKIAFAFQDFDWGAEHYFLGTHDAGRRHRPATGVRCSWMVTSRTASSRLAAAGTAARARQAAVPAAA